MSPASRLASRAGSSGADAWLDADGRHVDAGADMTGIDASDDVIGAAADGGSLAGRRRSPNRLVAIPPAIAVITPASARKIANRGPIRPYVNAIASMSVSGVEIKNDTVAPFVAPCLVSRSAAGSTPHEHSGNGTPMAAAHRTEVIRPRPSSRTISRCGTTTASTPPSRNPNSRKTDAVFMTDNAS